MRPRRKWPVVLAVAALTSLAAWLIFETVARSTGAGSAPRTAAQARPVEVRSGPPMEKVASEDGAVGTSLELASAPQQWLHLTDTELEAAVRAIAAPGSADRLVDEVRSEVSLLRDALQHAAGRVWWVVRPLAWRVDSYSAQRVSVSVWTVSILSAADVAVPQSDWFTTTFDLRWADGRWLLVGSHDDPGPTPQVGGREEPWQPEPFDDALGGFTRVGFGGTS